MKKGNTSYIFIISHTADSVFTLGKKKTKLVNEVEKVKGDQLFYESHSFFLFFFFNLALADQISFTFSSLLN